MTSPVTASTSNRTALTQLPQESQSPFPVDSSVNQVGYKILSLSSFPSGSPEPRVYMFQENDSTYQSILSLLCSVPQQKQNDDTQERLQPLLTSFGIPFADNRKDTLARVEIILDSLKNSDVFTDFEKTQFLSLCPEAVIEDIAFFLSLLQSADRHNLVILFSDICPSLKEKSFPEKVTAVLEYLKEKGEVITTLTCNKSTLTAIPEEVHNLKNLNSLDICGTQVTFIPQSIKGQALVKPPRRESLRTKKSLPSKSHI